MTDTAPPTGLYIDTPDKLRAWLDSLPPPADARVALDTEADSLHSYKEKLCLVQMAVGPDKALIDPLGVPDLTPLMDYLCEAEVWLHGADFDMTLMRRTFDRIPPTIFDTQIAARLTGARQFGLAAMVENTFGITLSKQSQRADWGRRPLTQKMIDYAFYDVHYIIELADIYLAKLRALGREEWFNQCCEDARNSVLKRAVADPDEMWRVPGSGKLRPRGLHMLRAVWHWRDHEASRIDRPTFKIISNAELLAFGEAAQEGNEVRLPDRYPPPFHRRFYKALKDASEVPESDWPRRPPRRRVERNPEAEKRFEGFKEKRDRLGASLDLDPSLIASRSALEAIAADQALAPTLLLPWQLQLMDFQAI